MAVSQIEESEWRMASDCVKVKLDEGAITEILVEKLKLGKGE